MWFNSVSFHVTFQKHGKLEISSRNIHIRLWMEHSNSISQEFYISEVNPFSLVLLKLLFKRSTLFSYVPQKTQTICNYADQRQMVNIMSLSKSCGIDRYATLTHILFTGVIHHQTLWRSAGEEAARLFQMQHLPPVCLRAWRPVCF